MASSKKPRVLQGDTGDLTDEQKARLDKSAEIYQAPQAEKRYRQLKQMNPDKPAAPAQTPETDHPC
jgi:hypothetical protein